jgi:hypothetical protein
MLLHLLQQVHALQPQWSLSAKQADAEAARLVAPPLERRQWRARAQHEHSPAAGPPASPCS